MIIVLLHHAADLHCHDVSVTGIGFGREVDLSVGMQRIRSKSLSHFFIGAVAAGCNNDAFCGIDLCVVIRSAGDKTGNALVRVLKELNGRSTVHQCDAGFLQFFFKAGHERDIADTFRVTIGIVKIDVLVIEEVRDGELGVCRTFVVAFPQRHVCVVFACDVDGPIHAVAALSGKHPKQAFIHPALAPSNQATNDLSCIDIDAHLLLQRAVECGDVTAAAAPAACFFYQNDFGTFLSGCQCGCKTRKTCTDHHNVGIHCLFNLFRSNLGRRFFPAPAAALRLLPLFRNITGMSCSSGHGCACCSQRTFKETAARKFNF